MIEMYDIVINKIILKQNLGYIMMKSCGGREWKYEFTRKKEQDSQLKMESLFVHF